MTNRPPSYGKGKICPTCEIRFYISRSNETQEEFDNRVYCSVRCKHNQDTNLAVTVMAHELVRIRIGNSYMSIDGKLTTNIDNAKLIHPYHAWEYKLKFSNMYKSEAVYTENNLSK